MNMSWGLKGTAQTVDEAIAGAIEAGIHVSVAAGNDGKDACGSTPAHLGGGVSNVVSVGSVNIKNQVSTFSNIGTCVDIYAPGEQVISAWNQGDAIIEFLSGTSMACPHVTGVMAYLIGQDPSLSQNPAALKAKLLQTARTGAVSGNLGGSANLLLSNGVDGGITAKRLVKNYVDVSHSGLNGSPAARAAAAVANDIAIDKRFKLHSRGSQLRF
jgi:cerevisin